MEIATWKGTSVNPVSLGSTLPLAYRALDFQPSPSNVLASILPL